MARLSAATTVLHDDRELLAGRVSGLDYRLYLVRMYGFHAAVERALTAFQPLATVVADAGLRNHKAALLAHDLVALGVERCQLAQLPCMAAPRALALSEALGWTYVVEAQALRGKHLARRLARHLPAEIQRASAYLECYGDEGVTRWRELGDAIDAFALGRSPARTAPAAGSSAAQHTPEPGELADLERACERVIATARDGLEHLRRWLGPAWKPRANQRHA
jgi:heme oxygenase